MIYAIGKWVLVLNELNKIDEVSMISVSKKLNLTYSHTVKLFHKFEKDKFITTVKKGRIRYVTLTAKGKKLSEICSGLITGVGNSRLHT